MNRRELLVGGLKLSVGLSLGLSGWALTARHGLASDTMTDPELEFEKLTKSKDDWQALLESFQYDVLFREATERPFTSPLNDEKREGVFVCSACYLPLFESGTKFDSGTGWPSFFDAIPGRLETKTDWKIGYPRKEYHCARCGGHQGHIFKDGPKPTGLRYCNNGVALEFVAKGEALPELRP